MHEFLKPTCCVFYSSIFPHSFHLKLSAILLEFLFGDLGCVIWLCCSAEEKAKMIDILTRMQNQDGDGESDEEGLEGNEGLEERLAKIDLGG